MESTSLICTVCKQEKTKQNFSGGRRFCNSCYAAKARKKYAEDANVRKKASEATSLRIKQNKEKAIAYLGNVCFDCKGLFPQEVYDFHHLDPKEKEISPSKAKFRSWENYKKELDKCVLLCANCHRIRHSGEIYGS